MVFNESKDRLQALRASCQLGPVTEHSLPSQTTDIHSIPFGDSLEMVNKLSRLLNHIAPEFTNIEVASLQVVASQPLTCEELRW